ncbi:hypothetical protein [Micromonospora sp. NPDC049891]
MSGVIRPAETADPAVAAGPDGVRETAPAGMNRAGLGKQAAVLVE